MKLVIGLGNPEAKYQWTRHNFGWLVLDNIANKKQLTWKKHKVSLSEVAEFSLGAEKIILAKPLTFMNNSGLAVQALKHFYKITPKNIIVIYDDLDLPFGKIRISANRSGGGHNGVNSIIEHLKSKEFIRIRLGLAPQQGKAEDFVLQNFSVEQKKKIPEIADTAALALETIIAESPDIAANKYN